MKKSYRQLRDEWERNQKEVVAIPKEMSDFVTRTLSGRAQYQKQNREADLGDYTTLISVDREEKTVVSEIESGELLTVENYN